MGVSSSLFSGVSGLNANGNAMSVIGNNIANANTVGFKSSRTLFGDLLSSQVSGSGGFSQVGRGVGLSTVDNIFSQGTFETTELNTDLAVEGSGFFIVSDPSNGNVTNNYTRAGSFRFDADGFFVNPEGYNVMGYQLDDNGNTIGDLAPLKANTNSFTQAGATYNVALNTNLDSGSVAIQPPDIFNSATTMDLLVPAPAPDATAYTNLIAAPAGAAEQAAALAQALVDEATALAAVPPDTTTLTAINDLRLGISGTQFNLLDPSNSSNYATSIRLFDSLGSTHLMTTYFTKTADQTWTWNAVVDAGEIGGTEGELQVIGSGILNFDASGNLASIVDDPAVTQANALTWSNGAVQTQQVTFDMQTTQYASPSVVVSQEQDGYGTGTLVKLNVDGDGNIVGNFSNGQPRKLMRMALAKFTNPGGLEKMGNNLWANNETSGPAVVGTVGSGVGGIFTNALEQSNVDLAAEFVKMIITQRGFSANSKTITTTDEMLAEVINLKR